MLYVIIDLVVGRTMDTRNYTKDTGVICDNRPSCW